MKGILVKSLVTVVIFAGAASAQNVPIFDAANMQFYGSALQISYPLARDFNGGGARARGMGGAFIGVSDDPTAVTWNPAGLYRSENQYEQPVVGLGYQSLSSDASFTSQPYPDFAARSFDFHDVANDVNFMSLVMPIRIKGHMFVGSIAYARLGDEVYNSGMGFDVDFPFDGQDSVEAITRPYHYQLESNFRSGVNALNIGFGTRLYSNWSFGISVNAYGGRSALVVREQLGWEELNLTPITGVPGNQRASGTLVNNVWDTTGFSGVYFTLGFRYAADKLSAGLLIKTPHTLKQTFDVARSSEGYINGMEVDLGGSAIYSDNNIIELDQPTVVGLGLGYKVSEKLLLAADLEYRPFGNSMINIRDSLELVPGGTDIEYFHEVDPYWNKVWTIRTGTEYLWETGSELFPVVPVRAGFGYAQLPTPNVDYYVDPAGNKVVNPQEAFLSGGQLTPVTSTGSTAKWSLGAGVRWAQIDLDFSYENWTGDLENSPFAYKMSADNSAFNVTFTGYF